jgi:hypothetical protein
MNRFNARLIVAFLVLVTSSMALAELAPAPAEASYYHQTIGWGCEGDFMNWRGDYTTGYAWFGRTYAPDSDCSEAWVALWNSGTLRASDWDTSYVYNVTVSTTSSATHSSHAICRPDGEPPYYEYCNTQHWLNL